MPDITYGPQYLAASECLELGEDCHGRVEYHAMPDSLTTYPRCEAHWVRRLERYEGSIEQAAGSDSPPAWYDPTYAGESWEPE